MDWPACGRGLRPRALRAPSPLRSVEPSRWFSSITCCGRQESATVRSEWVLPRVMSSFAKPTEDTFASVPDAIVVVEDGFEPSKVGDRLIYSQMRLATSLLHRTKKKRFSSRLTPQSARTFYTEREGATPVDREKCDEKFGVAAEPIRHLPLHWIPALRISAQPAGWVFPPMVSRLRVPAASVALSDHNCIY